MDHLNQEPLDFAAALTLLREAREEVKRMRAAPPEVRLTDKDIEKLKDLRPGPIEVVYPLDEEWNAALEAAAKLCDEAADNANLYFDHMAEQIRALKRRLPQKS